MAKLRLLACMVRGQIFGGALLASALLAACDRPQSDSVREALAELESQFPISESRTAATNAIEGWPNCLQEPKRLDSTCAEWAEGGINYTLRPLASPSGRMVPVIESRITHARKPNRVIVHLTGGPNSSPYAAFNDLRRPVYQFLKERGYLIASIGYWGTNFRTTLGNGEVELASQDLADTLAFYQKDCQCNPVIIAESMGAGVTFNYINDGGSIPGFAVFMAPVMDGLDSAVEIFRKERESEGAFTRATTQIYKLEPAESETFVRKTMVDNASHLSRFVVGGKTRPSEELLQSTCPTFVIGEYDRLNLGFTRRNLPSVSVIKGARHDVFENNASAMIELLEQIFSCHGAPL